MGDSTSHVAEILPVLSEGLKRKRHSSEDAPEGLSEETNEAKRRKPHGSEEGDPEPLSGTGVDELQEDGKRLRHVRETIEGQFSLEILLKHNELRLINQELAKCQVALEQLRRCSLIPYPIAQGTPEAMLHVSSGTGPAVSNTNTVPQWAAPYGVTDGPYTRHYARWLIPDPSFDGQQVEWNRVPEGSRMAFSEGRSTRHSVSDLGTPISKARTQRGFTGQKLQALSSGYPQAKEKAGPCILKRQDGQMVKLVCIDCKRDNFSSTQGFINHCRIAHRRDFKSHEEAAVASGQPIEIDEVGGIVGEEKPPPVATGLVHPLVANAPTDRKAYLDLISRIDASMALFKEGKHRGVTSIPTSATSTPIDAVPALSPHENFVPSSDVPYLSKLMRSKGFDGNLTEMVVEAKQPVEFEELSSPDEESEDGERATLASSGGIKDQPVMRVPARAAISEMGPQRHLGGLDGTDNSASKRARATMSPAPLGRPGSSKGLDSIASRKFASPRPIYATPAVNEPTNSDHSTTPPHLVSLHRHSIQNHRDSDGDGDMLGPSYADLSPNTVASNNAPSLVSDDGEYDEGDDAESASSDNEEEGSDVAEIDIEDGEVEKVVARTVIRNRSGSASEAMRMRKEDKHVTFVSSPVKEAKAKGRGHQ
jgi:ADA HAT complex component 1